MAEAAVDQPENLAPPLAGGDADALLAQMAGEQIDRMLSGMEIDSPPPGDDVKEAFEKLETNLAAAADPIEELSFAKPIEEKAGSAAAEHPAKSEPIDAVASESEKPSLLVKILEAVNSPLAACPDWLRDALGKIAIATLLNAVGVLIFVRFFMHR